MPDSNAVSESNSPAVLCALCDSAVGAESFTHGSQPTSNSPCPLCLCGERLAVSLLHFQLSSNLKYLLITQELHRCCACNRALNV